MTSQFSLSLKVPDTVSVVLVKQGAQLRNYCSYLNGKLIIDHEVSITATAKFDLRAFLIGGSTDKSVQECWRGNAKFNVSTEDITVYPKPGYVYLIYALGSNRYKIGYSNDPIRRLKELKGLQPAQSPFDLKLLAVSPMLKDMGVLEMSWHQILADFRVRGEWFDLPEDLARNVAIRLVRGRIPSLKIDRDIDYWDWSKINDVNNLELENEADQILKLRQFLDSYQPDQRIYRLNPFLASFEN